MRMTLMAGKITCFQGSNYYYYYYFFLDLHNFLSLILENG